jgi:WhiB family redox-sensing transcriptional regulator
MVAPERGLPQGRAVIDRPALRPYTFLWDWQLHARCRSLGTDTFYGSEGETRGARVRRERTARHICALCPVRDACREHALRTEESYGIWGGTSAIERARIHEAR